MTGVYLDYSKKLKNNQITYYNLALFFIIIWTEYNRKTFSDP